MALVSVLEGVSPKTIVLGAIALYIAFLITRRISYNRKIAALGEPAPFIKTKLPFAVDLLVAAMRANMNHENIALWRWFFESTGRVNATTSEARPLGERFLFTVEPENIKAILATQFQDYGKGEPFHLVWKEFLGDSIFTTDLDQWHASRQLIRPQFIKDRVSDINVFERHFQILANSMANGGVVGMPGVATDGRGVGRKVDAADLFFRYSLDVATEFLLGNSVGSLETADQPFAQAFGEVQRVQSILARAGPLGRIVPRTSFRKGLKVMDEFVEKYIDEALRLSPDELASKTKSDHGYTFLHALAGFTRDKRMLRDQLVAILLAGRDTTASTLSWTFYELARHPEAVEKLRAEIKATIGNDAPSYQDLKNMKCLQNTMNEVLRLYPVVPFNVRLALHDTTLPTGGGPNGDQPIGVLKNNSIGYSALYMQRRLDLYPESWLSPAQPHMHPHNFNPDRWQVWQPKPWTYIPFNGGPRICIGQQFALTEMGYTIVRLLQRFERIDSLVPEGIHGEPILRAEIILQSANGVNVAFWDAVSEKN